MEQTKQCTKCNEIKTLDCFYKAKNGKHGVRSDCKECQNKCIERYQKENKEKLKEYHKKYHQENKEQIKEYHKKWREENKEYEKEYKEKYYIENKEILKEYFKKYRQGNKEKLKECHKKWREENKEYEKEYREKYYIENKERLKEYFKKHRQGNKEKIKEYNKKYCKENKEQLKEKRKEYFQKNKEKIREYQKNRKETDPLFKLKCNLRTRVYMAFKRKSYNKTTSTIKLLGTDIETAKKHIERQFTKGMSWDNHGEWHIDHIIPLSSANTEKRLKELCHYTNLQPLWASDNISKSDKIINQQTMLRI